MTEDGGVDRWWTTLEQTPEIAAALGMYVAEVASVEALLFELMAMAIGEGPGATVAYDKLGRKNGFKPKCDMVRTAANEATLPEPVKQAINEFVDRAEALGGRRNELIHSIYQMNERTREVRMVPYVLTANRRPEERRHSVVTAADLHRSRMEVRQFVVSLTHAFPQLQLPTSSP